MVKRIVKLGLEIVFAVTLAACTTTGSQQQEPIKAKKPIAHPHASSKSVAVPAVTSVQVPNPLQNDLEYTGFFEKVSSSSQDFTEKDRQQFMGFAITDCP